MRILNASFSILCMMEDFHEETFLKNYLSHLAWKMKSLTSATSQLLAIYFEFKL